MANAVLPFQTPSAPDKNLDAEQLTVDGNTVNRERIQVTGTGDTDIAPVSAADGLTVNLGSNNDVTVTSSALPSDAATSANQATEIAGLASIDGHVDGIEGALTTLNAKDFATQTTLAAIDGHVDGVEALLTTIDADTSNLDVALSTRLKPADTLTAVTTVGTVTTITNVVHVDDNSSSLTIDNANLDVALSTRLKPADTLTAVTTVGTITNVVHVDDNSSSLTIDNANLDVALSTRLKAADTLTAVTTLGTITNVVHVDDNSSTLSVDDGGGSITVDGTVAVSGSITADTELTTADLDTGAGTDTRAVIGLVFGASGGGTLVSTTNPLPIGDNGGSVTVDGTIAATQSGTWTVQPGNTANTTAWKVDASSVAVPITDNSGSLTVDQPTGTNLHMVVDSGTVSTITNVVHVDDNSGSLTVDAPVGTPVFVRLSDGSSAIATLPVSLASVPSHAVTNAGVFVVQENGAALTSLQLIDDTIFTDDTSTHSTGSTKGVGIMAAAVPTDTNINANDIGMVGMTTDRRLYTESTQSGTWTVQPGNTANTTAWKVDASSVAVPITDNSGSLTVDQPTGTNLHMVVDSGTVSTITNVVHVDDNSSSLTVDYATTGSGTATGALRVELPTNGTGVVGLNAGTQSIGKLGANSGVDIGDVTLNNLTSTPVFVQHNTTSVSDGRKVVTTAGTRVALASSTACVWVVITAETDNTGLVVVGGASTVIATLATRQGTPLYAGDSLTLLTDNLADIGLDSTVNGDGVTFAYGA